MNRLILLAAAVLQVNAWTTPDPRGVTWAAAHARANATLAKLTKSEKIGLVTGVGWQVGACVGNTRAVARLGIPSLCMQDGPVGVRYARAGSVTVFPAGVHAAATWDRELIRARSKALAEEARGLGIHVMLAPVAGPLGRNPRGGRNWEGFSPDPYLTGKAMEESVVGMQEVGVQANAKHFIGNEQEQDRTEMTSNIDDRTLHELYLWPFADAVQANVASVMCSYNKLNTTWACENGRLLNGLLKEELQFKGYVVSDWNAQHTTVGSARAGLDMAMPGDDFSGQKKFLWADKLANAVPSQVPQARLNDMVRRILASFYYLGQDKGYPERTFNSWKNGTGGPNVQGDHKKVAHAVARDGIVLLKNEGVLPLKPTAKTIAIIGDDAFNNPAGPNACVDRGCNKGTLAMGWGSGTAEFPYISAPNDAIRRRAFRDGTKVVQSTTNDAGAGAAVARGASLALVFVNSDAGEQYVKVENVKQGDRLDLNPWHNGNGLVEAVARTGVPTVVVVHSVGPVLLERILAQKNVKGIVWAGLPGQESGNALADVLFGDVAPSGKLPYTIAKREEDYGVQVAMSNVSAFVERSYIDYRWFDARGIAPRYEFGFGLSYTTFAFSNLTIGNLGSKRRDVDQRPRPRTLQDNYYATTGHIISVTVTNTGRVAGAEVAQLYLSLAPQSGIDFPPQQLRGFQKVQLKPGEAKTLQFRLRQKDVAYWNVGAQEWTHAKGKATLKIASSSRAKGVTRDLWVE